VSPGGRAEFACGANEQINQRQMFHFDSSESGNNAAILRGSCRVRDARGLRPVHTHGAAQSNAN
jgi:hypothetical protein